MTFWLSNTSLTIYLCVFYICISVVILVILDIFYVSYSFKQKKFAFVWPLKLLRALVGMFVTALFLPFIECFTLMLECSPEEGETWLGLFPFELVCWKGEHIIHAAFSIVISLIFIGISLIVSLTFYESNGYIGDISAKVNARADFYLIIMQIILSYLYAFFHEPRFHWFIMATLLITSSIGYFMFRANWPYYSTRMNKTLFMANAIFLWGNYCAFLCLLLQNTDFSAGLYLYFIGFPLVVAAVLFEKDERVGMLQRNME